MSTVARTTRVVWSIVAVVALLCLVLAISSAVQAVRAGNWHTVDGEILQSEYALGCGRGGNQPFPDVRYSYRFDGKSYTGSRIALDTEHCGWASTAKAVAHKYKPGQSVRVYVHPDKPFMSALMAGDAQPETMTILAASIAALMLASYKLVRNVRRAG